MHGQMSVKIEADSWILPYYDSMSVRLCDIG